MSKEQFDLIKPKIEAVTDEETVVPNMPVATALQEAEDLYEWCQEDKAILEKVGLDLSDVENLPVRIGACRYMQSIWQREYKSAEQAETDWKEQSPAAYKLRNDMLHDFFYAYRNNPDKLALVRKIAEGAGHADMIQDLHDMSVLGEANPDQLDSINFDMTLLPKAATTSAAMASLLAKANGDHLSNNKTKQLRDKAYTYMKKVVDEIRAAGQYKFWHTPARHKGYTSMYLKSKNAAAETQAPPK